MKKLGNIGKTFVAISIKSEKRKSGLSIAKRVEKPGDSKKKIFTATLGKSKKNKDGSGVARSIKELGGGKKIYAVALVKNDENKDVLGAI